VLIRHLRQLKTVIFLHWCLICTILLFLVHNLNFKSLEKCENFNYTDTSKFKTILLKSNTLFSSLLFLNSDPRSYHLNKMRTVLLKITFQFLKFCKKCKKNSSHVCEKILNHFRFFKIETLFASMLNIKFPKIACR
jgi:hypothetical protein